MIKGVSFQIEDGVFAHLYKSGESDISWNDSDNPGFIGICEDSNNQSVSKPYFEYRESDLNIAPLRLKETVRYSCVIYSNSDFNYLDFKPEIKQKNKYLKIESENNHYTFQFINYLGKAEISFGNKKTLQFEVVANKIDYDRDYINLTEAIAEECSALLLDYTSPTSLTFSQDVERQSKSILEQFIFLRKFCHVENLESLFASIKRNPDRILVSEEVFKPFGTGVISQKFFSNPFSYGKQWNDLGEGTFLPSEIATTRKYDSFDTAANRFLKFALNTFLEICTNIREKVHPDKSVYHSEACVLAKYIEDVLNDAFFDDVQELTIMPVNNQVLEKREGYAQIFKAFAMVDMALQLDWKGQEDVYSGESKNTALLYEYWLFFVLRKIIKNIDGCKLVDEKDETESFETDRDGLSIVLKQGTKSVERFESGDLRINLYYNYTFLPKHFRKTKYEGSYSRSFRPDYTIAIYPKFFKREADAIVAGEVHYIHFDAKYRLEDLSLFVNKENLDESEINKEINEEKNDSVMNTYKRGDLLKMHTYNDAIRSTIGSFVLYPGVDNNDKKPFSVYEEILPGVGAFAIKPGDINNQNLNAGERELQNFIKSVVDFNANPASRNARIEYFNKIISESPSELTPVKPSNGSADLYMLGFLRNEYHDWLLEKHFIPKAAGDNQFKTPETGIYFYYHAIREGYVYPQHKDIVKAKYFCARCRTDYSKETNVAQFDLDPWIAEVESTKLVSAEQLARYLKEMNDGDGFEPKGKLLAEYYYLVQLKNIHPTSLSKESFVSMDSGNLAISAYSPKVARRVK